MTHNAKKTHECTQCNYASVDAGGLKKHEKIHGGEKTNKCNQCMYQTLQSSNLRIHMKNKHSGEKSISVTIVILKLPGKGV